LDERGSEFPLREYLRVVNRRRWIIIITVLAAIGVSTGMSVLADRVYVGTAQVLVSDPAEGSLFNPSLVSGLLAGRTLQTQMQVLRSRPIAREVERLLGERAALIGTTRISGIGDTDVIAVKVESTVPSVARDTANTYAKVYVERRQRQAVDTLLRAGDELQRKAQEKKDQLADLDAQIARLQSAPKPDTAQIDGLRTQRNDLESQYARYRDQFDELQIDAALRKGGAQIVAEAALPGVPVRPTPVRNGILAMVLGLFIGGGLAFLFEFLDDTVKSSEDLERHAPSLAFLGAIPQVSDWRNRERPRVVSLEDPQSAVAEAYRSLRTSVQFVGLKQPLQTLLLTSPMSSEGKTTTLANLGVTLARSGKAVVMVDCDLRRPRIHEFFNLSHDLGFTSVLLGEVPASVALQTIAVAPGAGSLRLLASGPLPPNPSELLGTGRVAEVLTALQASADIVLIDSPPLLPVTDALVVSRRVDGVLVVATAGLTSRRHLARGVELLKQAEAPAIGVVLNGVGAEKGYGYEYRYHYYRQEGGSRRARRAAARAAR
jgi:non-specific protein-tyrosine kinase